MGSGVPVLVTTCGFSGGLYGVWVGFSLVYPSQKFHSTISPHHFVSFNFISPCNDALGMVGRHFWKTQIFSIWGFTHFIPWRGSVSDTSWRGWRLQEQKTLLEGYVQMHRPTDTHPSFIHTLFRPVTHYSERCVMCVEKCGYRYRYTVFKCTVTHFSLDSASLPRILAKIG